MFRKGLQNLLFSRREARWPVSARNVVHDPPGCCRSLSSDVSNGPLHGVRVLDISRIVAGPFCTMLLGDLGAEVIKVEQPGQGDDTRTYGPPFVGDQACYYLAVNRNKKGIAVNIKTPGGKQIIQDLVKKSDVFVENFPPGKLDKLGLGYKDLMSLAPSLIHCSVTGFGPDGPYADRPGIDLIVSAIGGLIHTTGPEGGDPCSVGVAITDICTGLYAKGAITAALYHREKTGEGQKIECDLLSTQVSLLTHHAANYLSAGLESKRLGIGRQSIVPYQDFQTKDGQRLIIGAVNDFLFKVLCKVIDLNHLADDDRFQTNEKRVLNKADLVEILQARFSEESLADWLELLGGTRVPHGPIQSMDQVFNDPQVIHNNMILQMEHATTGSVKVAGPAVTYSSNSGFQHRPPPRLGEHTTEVLTDTLGMTHEHIERLNIEGAIACES